MKHFNFIFSIAFLLFLNHTVQAGIFETYKEQYLANQPTIIPDFSYVGYEFGEKSIPNVKYKVFNVKDYGAIPNDNISDKVAIQAAITAAQKNKSGIVYFPKGEYCVNEAENSETPITIVGSNIVLRGETGAVLFMRSYISALEPEKMWTTPYMFQFSAAKVKTTKATIMADAQAGKFVIETSDASAFKPGNWIQVDLKNNNPQRVAQEVAPYKLMPEWKEIIEDGVMVTNFHRIKSVKNNTITLYDPIMYPIVATDNWTVSTWFPATGCGIENLHFKGNFTEKFKHHSSAIHDGGWSIIEIVANANAWMKDCVFENVSNIAVIKKSANYTALNCKITGNGGHASISSVGSSRVLMAKCTDEASQWHAFGVSKMSCNTVIWRCKNPKDNCFESHATQPRNTLIDCMEGGFLNNRDGGAIHCLPNHLQNLVLWNYTKTNDTPFIKLEFWDSTKAWFKMLMPVVAGFKGEHIGFDLNQIKSAEAIGDKVSPESLYEAQLLLRLGKLPDWLSAAKAK